MRKFRLVLTLTAFISALALLSATLAVASSSTSRMTGSSEGSFYQSPVEKELPEGDGPWVVRAYFDSRGQVERLAAQLEPWEVHHNQGYLVALVDKTQYRWMLTLGFRLEVDLALTDEFTLPHALLPGQVNGIPGYPCYRTVEETYTSAQDLANAFPSLATWSDIGDTWEKTSPGGGDGYDLMVLKLTNALVSGPKPKLFIMGSIHAREYSPAELVTRFGEYLLDNYNIDADATWLLDYHEIHLLLQSNPDGRKKAETGLYWRKNTNNNYCSGTNSRGADLNRNFEFQWGCCGGSSGDQCSEVYRGPSPASEPETQAVQNYVRSQFPDQRADPLTSPAPPDATGVFLDIHSYGRLVLWPWGFTDDQAPNNTALQTLGRKFAFFNGYLPEQSVGLYPTDGATDDFAYGELGVAAYTFELGTTFFQNCPSFENTIYPENLPSLIYAAKAARTPYLTPAGPDARSLTATPSNVGAGGLVQLSAIIDDTRFASNNGTEPSQNISAAEYYIDVPPWDTANSPIANPMVASDGSFNSSIEFVGASINTSGLSAGRHTVFVRGRDMNGNWGAVSALFITVYTSPEAAFTSNSPVVLGQAVHFDNLSTGTEPIEYVWDFGDGIGTSMDRNPSYVYSATGSYSVTLAASNLYGTGLITHTVQVDPCIPISTITLTQVTSGTFYTGDLVELSLDLSPANASKPYTYTVDFDDGSPPLIAHSSADPLVFSHGFATPGNHTVQATAWNLCTVDPGSDSANVSIAERHGATILPSPSIEFGDPGEVVTHTLRLTNIGDTPDTFTLTLGASVWSTSISTSALTLDPGGAADINVQVLIPGDAISGDEDGVELTAVSQYPATTSALVDLTTFASAVYGVNVTADPSQQVGVPGETITFTLVIENTGNASDTYDIQVVSSDWQTVPVSASTDIPNGATSRVGVSVQIPTHASGESDTAHLSIASHGDSAVQSNVVLITRASWRIYLPVVSN